jgi:SNF2 family DNA or RNA helicase
VQKFDPPVGSEMLIGEVPSSLRQGMMDRFQAKKSRVFIGTFGCAGVGITLTAAHDVILIDRPWTPGDAAQAEDRCHRVGQQISVTCHWLQAMPVDCQMDELLTKKQEKINQVLADPSSNKAKLGASNKKDAVQVQDESDVWQSSKSVVAKLYEQIVNCTMEKNGS